MTQLDYAPSGFM